MKKIKSLAITLTIGFSQFVLADRTPIPVEKVPLYKKAVISYLQNNHQNFSCNDGRYGMDGAIKAINNISYSSPIAIIDNLVKQPLLEFSNDEKSQITSIVTTSDYKKILEFTIEEFDLVEENSGDLLNPIFITIRRPWLHLTCHQFSP